MSNVIPSTQVQKIVMGSDHLAQKDESSEQAIQVESYTAVSARGSGYRWSVGWIPTDVESNEEEHGDADRQKDL